MALKFRDVTLLPVSSELYMAVSCDVSASIGEKIDDVLKAPTEMTGAYCARVALLEILALGATPQALIHTVGNEFFPTGEASLRGIQEELRRAGYSQLEINGSSEDNMHTSMTAIGVTVIGTLFVKDFKKRRNTKHRGDSVYLIGEPIVGEAVKVRVNEIISYEAVEAMTDMPSVRDILPVGSRGILEEMETLLMDTELQCIYEKTWQDAELLKQSGGPSTSVLAVVAAGEEKNFEKALKRIYPVFRRLGRLW